MIAPIGIRRGWTRMVLNVFSCFWHSIIPWFVGYPECRNTFFSSFSLVSPNLIINTRFKDSSRERVWKVAANSLIRKLRFSRTKATSLISFLSPTAYSAQLYSQIIVTSFYSQVAKDWAFCRFSEIVLKLKSRTVAFKGCFCDKAK